MTILFNPRFWIAAALAVMVSVFGFLMFRSGKASIRAEFDAYVLAQTKASQKAEAEHRAKEQEWQSAADKTTKAKDEQIRSINARADQLASELRNRSPRPASGSVPKDSGTGSSATGSKLYRDDAEFLTRLAASADRAVAERDACRSQYQALMR